ncbi:hypothetical protein IW262DRAFT_1468096 [Armillaria fumosa]|nr:hypothetical protein IW262DRAFT_1468096 [Armillaria fumosa]
MGSLLPSAEIIQPRRGFLQGRSRPLLHRGIFEPEIARQRAHSDSFLMNEIEYFARLGLYKVAPGLHPIHPPTQVLEEYDAIDDVEYAYFLQTASRFNLDETAVGLLVRRFNSASGIRRRDLQRLENNSTPYLGHDYFPLSSLPRSIALATMDVPTDATRRRPRPRPVGRSPIHRAYFSVATSTARAASDLSLIQDIRNNVRNGTYRRDPFVHPAHIPYHPILADYDTSANRTIADRVLHETKYSDTRLALLVRRLNSLVCAASLRTDILATLTSSAKEYAATGTSPSTYRTRLARLLFLVASSPFHRAWISEIRLLLLGQSGTPGLEFPEMSLPPLRQDTFVVVDAVFIGDFLRITRISMLVRGEKGAGASYYFPSRIRAMYGCRTCARGEVVHGTGFTTMNNVYISALHVPSMETIEIQLGDGMVIAR